MCAIALAIACSIMVLPVKRRGHDKAALALADRRDQIDDAGGVVLVVVLELDPLLRIERRQVVEQDLVARLLGLLEVDRFDLEQREVALALLGRTNQPGTMSPVRRLNLRIWLGEM